MQPGKPNRPLSIPRVTQSIRRVRPVSPDAACRSAGRGSGPAPADLTDKGGNTVRETITNAYRLAP
ncbi:hypothetical protein PV726_31030 [Streptomyces europaeiscabiei]|uniref:hypothetical protein n=1 Tax=Streptomyces europaeiscabiei TaxID=146819 RepID=UPI0029B379DC|nr:hypothetical protein [Streptomyces europaeiscabiei]MDX3694687.1 hypothetical protein [Streptomyces europaeiscabiei]